MNVRLLVFLAAAIGWSLPVFGQAAAENLNLSTGAAKSLSAPTKALNDATQKIADKSAQAGSASAAPADPPPPPPVSPTLWEAKDNTPSKPYTPPRPATPAVFVLASGERIETGNYFMTVNSVRVEQDGKQRTIPMKAVNVDATLAANRERGVNLKFPTSKSQITLSF